MQNIYRDEMVAGRAGALADNEFHDIINLINEDPLAAQVDTLTIDTATNSHTYTITIEDIAISYTADASATKPEITAGLKAAVLDEPVVSGLFTIADDGVDTLTFTAVQAGVGWTTTESDAKMTLVNTTANDEADPVGFGLAIVGDSASDKYGKLGKTANLATKTVTLTPVVGNDTIYNVNVKFRGVDYLSTYTSDGTATAKEIVEGVALAINTNMPANSVVATEDDAVLTLTAEIAGEPFTIGFDEALWAYAETVATVFTDINRCFRGVSLQDMGQETDSDGVTQYAGGSVMKVLDKGRVIVATAAEVSFGDHVYVTATGGFTKTAGADTPRLDPNLARWVKSLSSTLAVLKVNFPD